MKQRYKLSELYGINTPRNIPTGKMVPNGRHQPVPETIHIEFMTTKFGMIKITEWRKLVHQAIADEGLTDTYQKVLEYVSNLPWLKKDREKEDWALDCMIHKSYEHWDDFSI